MKNKNWRDVAEVAGIISIVAGLILVAWEVRQANNIAKTQMVMELAAQANEFNGATYENAELAKLVAAISSPNYFEYSEAQEAMMTAAAWHFANIFWSAQRAHDNGLLGDDDILMYQSSLAWHIENMPGLKPSYKAIYDTAPWLRDMFVFQPLVELACGSRKSCGDLTSDTSAIADALESAVKDGKIPGVIGIAATRDEVVYQGAAGVRDVSNGEPMTVDTIVRIASMTKAITSVGIMQLVEQEKIRLDDPVGQYLPRFADAQVLEGFDADDKPILRPAKSPVTVRHLLTHTSGYVYEIWNADAGRNVELGNVASILAGGDAFLDTPLSFDPGTQWEYGIGTDVLGILIEAISGQSLDVYFQQQIFTPLKMQDTFFNVPEEKQHRVATIHSKSVDGELTPIPLSLRQGGFLSGGGGLLSTAGDYTRFLQAMLNGGELDDSRILNGSTVHLMAQNHIGELEAANSIVSSAPSLSNDVNILPDSVDKFGLGFLINSDPVPGGRSAGSLAWAGMYNSYYWIDIEKGICGVLITQILPFYDAEVVTLFDNFEKSIYAVANQ